jgi:hypothetical protein
MQPAEPQQEHHWLERLVGDWTFEGECPGGPDQPGGKYTGTERVRPLGGLWVVCEGEGALPDGSGTARTMMTLGYDPQKRCYVGTWVGSMMANMWVYQGELDASGKVLPLHTEGPNCMAEGQTARYRDVIEFKSPDHRTLTSSIQGPDGEWQQFMVAHYRRKK